MTFADIVDDPHSLEVIPIESVITGGEDLCTCQCLDYIFVINRNTSTLSSNINSSPIRSRPADYNNIIVNPNDIQLGISDSKTQENSSEHRKELIGNRLVVDVQSTKIEKFFVKGHPFTQLSDHFGISTQLNIE